MHLKRRWSMMISSLLSAKSLLSSRWCSRTVCVHIAFVSVNISDGVWRIFRIFLVQVFSVSESVAAGCCSVMCLNSILLCVCVCVVEFLWWWRFGTETPPAETSWWDEPPSSCLTCWALRGADSWHRRESRAGDKLTRTGSPWSNHTGRKQHWLTDWSCDACEPPLNNCFLHQPQWKGGRAELCGNAGGPGVG